MNNINEKIEKLDDEKVAQVAGGIVSESQKKQLEESLKKWVDNLPKTKCEECGKEFPTPDGLIGTSRGWHYCGACIKKHQDKGDIGWNR